MEGVVRTRVGYAGGSTKEPTYHHLGDHSETIEMDFDPSKVSYEDLLGVFWSSHSPTGPSYSRQYRSAVFAQDGEQEAAARRSMEAAEEGLGRKLYTAIEPGGRFYLAEDYHQKYRLRGLHDVAREYLAIYPGLRDFVDSTAVTRANGFAGGYGSEAQLRDELPVLGLSEEAGRLLERAVSRRW